MRRVAKLAASQGNKVLLKEVEEAAEQWKWLGGAPAESLGTVASVISLIGDGISMSTPSAMGNWEEAAAQAADMAVDARLFCLAPRLRPPSPAGWC